jgi:trehalose 6-phosphate synthase/trehalose 6-phosphate phosphatase
MAKSFFARLAETQCRVLLLNFDVILASLTEDRRPAIPEITSCLQKIVDGAETRVVLITANSADNLKLRINMQPMPEIWGNYGLERWLPDSNYQIAAIEVRRLQGLKAARYVVARANLGSCLEPRLGALILRWQGLSSPAAKHARNLAYAAWRPIAQSNSLLLNEFEGGMELRLPEYEPASAVRKLVDTLETNSIVVYIGDAQIDENTFRALREQDLSVLLGDEPRDTAANLSIRTAGDLLHFFSSWLATCDSVR